MMYCFITDCSALEDSSLYDRAYALLSADRKTKADFYRFGKDKRLSVTAGLFLRLVERSYGKISEDENGKPQVEGTYFNLSHSECYVAFAWSDNPVGIDIEQIGKNQDIAEKVMTHDEYYDFVKNVTKDDMEDVFTRMWTAKESLMKYTGLGFRSPPDTFRVLYGKELRCPQADVGFHELVAPDGYHATACSPDPDYICLELGVEELLSASSLEKLIR